VQETEDPALQPTALAVPKAPQTVVVRKGATPGPTTLTVQPPPSASDGTAFGTNWAETSRYALVSELARGGGGRIAIAIDRKLGRRVALKRALDTSGDERLEREALVLARLEHPAIVPIHDIGHDPTGAPYYTMKLVGGKTLAARIDEAKTFEQRLALVSAVTTVADAVAYAHSQHVIHRDLKPGNVLVGEFGEVAVIDWGLGKVLDAAEPMPASTTVERLDTTPLTVHGAVMGTPAYMAPEQARGAAIDERADVYAIGAMLDHVLSGDAPYGKLDGDATLKALLDGAPRPLDEREPRVPRELAAIVAKACARDLDQRYRSGQELAEDLHRFQTGRLVAAHRYSLAGRVWRWSKQHRAVLSAIVALVAIAAAVVLYLEFGAADSHLRDAQKNIEDTKSALHQTEAERVAAQKRASEIDAKRAQAEQQVQAKTVEVQESREELEAKNNALEATLKEANAARERADHATKQAEEAAAAAKQANIDLQKALDRERARVKELEQKKSKLGTTLD
jgi:hypothetical protein